jgi:hypothetical protein
MRWRIDVECSPSTDDLASVVSTMEMTVDLLADALTEMGMEPAVQSTVVP